MPLVAPLMAPFCHLPMLPTCPGAGGRNPALDAVGYPDMAPEPFDPTGPSLCCPLWSHIVLGQTWHGGCPSAPPPMMPLSTSMMLLGHPAIYSVKLFSATPGLDPHDSVFNKLARCYAVRDYERVAVGRHSPECGCRGAN